MTAELYSTRQHNIFFRNRLQNGSLVAALHFGQSLKGMDPGLRRDDEFSGVPAKGLINSYFIYHTGN
ncbi:hypothetical protein LJB99_04140 [Deltaproteobacteria bacterium OttesenSCG-928-K17]|nr:hypothetical protein [Deltaproteobacteria bacterium OttesenSCG-928-K17]